ncbi:hypothetical protein OG824_45940 [Streptomyces prunicolor]|uniref:hypothetical protein n=1 Tax=Streptomyces prunicolor TaxID=67348 RepID=UPI002259A90B|nr:hypothetical protein [Streptomyces prunicolor]MCX5242564.1 hypothetical protein [Streptomyces prunicolor]
MRSHPRHPRHPRIHDGRAHPRPHRAAALVAGAAALTTTLLATGCAGPAATTAAQDTTFDAVAFRLGPRGDVQLSGPSRTAIRPAGSYPVTAGRAHLFTRPAGSLLVVLRHWPDTGTERVSRGRAPRMPPLEGAAVETGFLVDTEDWVRAELDGHPLQWLRRATLRIDTTNTAAGDLARLTLSGPHGGRPGQPTPPPDDGVCVQLDHWTDRSVVLPVVAAGTTVGTALARLRKQCLDVQYASLPGTGRPGTVSRAVIPLAGRPDSAVVLPSDGGPGGPGDTVLVDPARPATLVVGR